MLSVRNDGSRRPEWLQYPEGLEIASPEYRGSSPCSGCRAEFGERHTLDCEYLVCPKCGKVYAGCDCGDPLTAWPTFESKQAMRRRIDQLASEFHGAMTSVQIGSDDAAVLFEKVKAFERMVALHRAGSEILNRYTPAMLQKWRMEGRTPRIVTQAQIMERRAYRIWLDWFSK